MNKNIKSLCATVSSILIASVSYAASTLNWGTVPASFRAYDSDGITLLPANASSSIAGFCQLIYLGSDNTYNGFITSGTGVQGDDVVVQTTWMGQGSSMNNQPGEFNGSYASMYVAGSKFEMRFFSSGSPNYAAGNVPSTGNYGLSQVYSTTGDPDLGGIDNFKFNQNYSATIAVVPEPSTVALMLAGLGVLGFARMRRK